MPDGLLEIQAALEHCSGQVNLSRGVNADFFQGFGHAVQRELKGVGPAKGDVIAVKVGEDHVRGCVQMGDDGLPDGGADSYLKGMGEETVTHVAQGDARIDEYAELPGLDQAGEPPDAQGFGAQDGDFHGRVSGGVEGGVFGEEAAVRGGDAGWVFERVLITGRLSVPRTAMVRVADASGVTVTRPRNSSFTRS
jgi:hypothetical protein